MKTITMGEWRKSPGEPLLQVIREHETFVITKAGKPVAILSPFDETITLHTDGDVKRGDRSFLADLAALRSPTEDPK